jgi:hypothetical protein
MAGNLSFLRRAATIGADCNRRLFLGIVGGFIVALRSREAEGLLARLGKHAIE